MNKFRIAAFGFRSLPPRSGSAGADKFAMELYPRLVKKGYDVIAYNRLYPGDEKLYESFEGVKIKYFKVINKSGFDSLLHSFLATVHIISKNTADVIHIHNGGNSIWALFLRLFGKRVFISQDGVDWKREKWKWYAKLYLYISSYITAFIPDAVIFDNVFSKDIFEKKIGKKFDFIPYGSEVPEVKYSDEIFQKLNLQPHEYFLFVGRFIPDKGLHYLVEAFKDVATAKKLVLIGGSPNPSPYEKKLKEATDPRILFTGYIYGDDTIRLMKNAYAYIQPSDVEGLSPVILTVMGLETPLICSDIQENTFIVGNSALTFKKSDVEDLKRCIQYSLNNTLEIQELAKKASNHAKENYSWDKVVDDHIKKFQAHI